MTFNDFKKKYLGKRVDYDNAYGAQCVDIIKQYMSDVYGVKAGAWGNAIDYHRKPSPAFLAQFNRVATPQAGDIVIFDAVRGNPYGHIAIVESLDGGLTIIEQNGATGNGSGTGADAVRVRKSGTVGVMAYFRHKSQGAVNTAVNTPPATVPRPDQRVIKTQGSNHRTEPTTLAPGLEKFDKGAVITLKGYVHGEAIKGNDIWFAGHSGRGYLWSGTFTDPSVGTLPNLTPVPQAPAVVAPTAPEPTPAVAVPEPTPTPAPVETPAVEPTVSPELLPELPKERTAIEKANPLDMTPEGKEAAKSSSKFVTRLATQAATGKATALGLAVIFEEYFAIRLSADHQNYLAAAIFAGLVGVAQYNYAKGSKKFKWPF